jgi:hypothetical protein
MRASTSTWFDCTEATITYPIFNDVGGLMLCSIMSGLNNIINTDNEWISSNTYDGGGPDLELAIIQTNMLSIGICIAIAVFTMFTLMLLTGPLLL